MSDWDLTPDHERAERIGFGMEYAYGEKRGNVVEFAHAVIDAGADIVHGHHSHIPQGYERYNGGFICYGLGNLLVPIGTDKKVQIPLKEIATIRLESGPAQISSKPRASKAVV